MSRQTLRAALAVMLAVAASPATFAHAHLRNALPAANSTVAAPTEVACSFTFTVGR